MAPTVRQYHLYPTDHIPNSPRPLLHYKNVLATKLGKAYCDPVESGYVHQERMERGLDIRYSDTQLSHFHSEAHESMAVLSGTALIRFGVADLSDNLHQNTYGSAWESGGITLEAEAGDIFIIPAGIAHKTYSTKPKASFKLLSPGSAHGIEADDPRKSLSELDIDGYTMMGAYNGGDWDFVQKGGVFEESWVVPKPTLDPVFGDGEQGLVKAWAGNGQTALGRKVSFKDGIATHAPLAPISKL